MHAAPSAFCRTYLQFNRDESLAGPPTRCSTHSNCNFLRKIPRRSRNYSPSCATICIQAQSHYEISSGNLKLFLLSLSVYSTIAKSLPARHLRVLLSAILVVYTMANQGHWPATNL
jgi:hypothetical protein